MARRAGVAPTAENWRVFSGQFLLNQCSSSVGHVSDRHMLQGN